MTAPYASCEATIDLSALRANAATAARLAEGREVIPVIKAAAYGHGAVEVARTLVASGSRSLAVVSLDEASQLRDAGIEASILVLGGLHDAYEAEEAAERRLTPVLQHAESLALAEQAAMRRDHPFEVQAEIDTGMSRMGVPAERAAEFLLQLDAAPCLALGGVFTHFSRADEADPGPSLEQLRIFRGVLAQAREAGITPAQIHAANSAGLLAGRPLLDALPEATAVRPGLMLYGVAPASHISERLEPVMCLRARVARVQELAPGASVGYGGSYRVPGRGSPSTPGASTRIATLPIGYADGVPRSTGNRGWVWIAGKRHPIAGRVSMDSIGVDVGDAKVAVGDEAILFGNPCAGEEGIRVEEAASWADTTGYEMLVRVGQRVPRRYKDEAGGAD